MQWRRYSEIVAASRGAENAERGALLGRGVAVADILLVIFLMRLWLAAEHDLLIVVLDGQSISHLSVRKYEDTLKGKRSAPSSGKSSRKSWRTGIVSGGLKHLRALGTGQFRGPIDPS